MSRSAARPTTPPGILLDPRTAAGRDDPAALREVAGQFEALFLQTMLKTMREASIGDPLFGDNEEHKMFQGMMDQQLSLEMSSGKGIGLADMLVRQLGGAEASKLSRPDASYPISRSRPPQPPKPAWSDAQAFARDIWPHSERTA